MANQLGNFPQGTTVAFTVIIKLGGVPPDITGDSVTLTIKNKIDDDDPGVLQSSADVTSQGAGGIAVFELTPADTAINQGKYWYDIIWITSASKEYQLDKGKVEILERVSDL